MHIVYQTCTCIRPLLDYKRYFTYADVLSAILYHSLKKFVHMYLLLKTNKMALTSVALVAKCGCRDIYENFLRELQNGYMKMYQNYVIMYGDTFKLVADKLSYLILRHVGLDDTF